jgi:hypothetical protein
MREGILEQKEESRRQLFCINFLAFIIASAGAFLPANNMLFPSTDGEFTIATTTQILHYWNFIPGLPEAPFEGLGAILQYNPILTPSLLSLALLHEKYGIWSAFMVCASLVFVSTYALGRAAGMPRGPCMIAAWAMPPLCLPYQSWLNLYLAYNLNTATADVISLTMLGLALTLRVYSSPRPYWPAAGFLAVVLWLFLANPISIVIVLPTLIPIGIGLILSQRSQRRFIARTAWLIAPSSLFVAISGMGYLLGIYTDTAVYFFGKEMNSTMVHLWRLVTVATVWDKGIDPIGGTWVGLALLGLLIALRRESQSVLRAVARSVLATMALLAIYAAAYLLTPAWVLPYPIYYEFALWPFYSLFAAYAVLEPFRQIARCVRTGGERTNRTLMSRTSFVVAIWLAVGVGLSLFLAQHPFYVATPLFDRPRENSIGEALRAQAQLSPNAPFRGSVATLVGFDGPSGAPADWFTVQNESNRSFLNFGSTHRLAYLWNDGIPTLEVYSETADPALYAVVSRLLDRPVDGQVRNILMVTQTNIALMESLGVRFVITDFPLGSPAQLVTQVTGKEVAHYLYELPAPNLGQYSPIKIEVAANAAEALARIGDPQFDFSNTVVLDQGFDQPLTRARQVDVKVVRGGWQVRAHSDSTSLLLLPLNMSSCVTLIDNGGATGQVIAMKRANITETALIFRGDIDTTLSLRVSPFVTPYCRLRDLTALKAFGLGDVPKPVTTAGPAR